MPNSPTRSEAIATIVVPVYNEDASVVEKLLRETYTTFGGTVAMHIVDDGSDVPCPYATISSSYNQGYGAALKEGIRASTTPWIITMDGDGQHRIRDVQRLIEFVKDFPEYDMVIGNRRLKEESFKRWWGRKLLNWTATLFANRWIADLNSGIRIFKREVALSYEPILCDRFSFTTTITMSFLTDGRLVDWLPIRVLSRSNGHSKVNLWKDGARTLYYIVKIGLALRTRKLREFTRPLVRWLR